MEIRIKLYFVAQSGDVYTFRAGFVREGLDIPQFGGGGLVGNTQADFAHILSNIPATLPQGQMVGLYEVPINLRLRGVKGVPWIGDFDLIEELATTWMNELGWLYTDDFDCIYTPSDYSPLPEEYQNALDNSTELDNGHYNIPTAPEAWPQTQGVGYATEHVGACVQSEGALLALRWAWLYSNTPQETSMVNLIFNGFYLPGDYRDQPYITHRFWPSVSTFLRAEGAYDTRYPAKNFSGWNGIYTGNPIGAIDVHTGLITSFPHVLTVSFPTIIPFLSPTKQGWQVTVQIPKASEPAYVFPLIEPPPPGKDDGLLPNLLAASGLLLNLLNVSLPNLSPVTLYASSEAPIGASLKPIGGASQKPIGGRF